MSPFFPPDIIANADSWSFAISTCTPSLPKWYFVTSAQTGLPSTTTALIPLKMVGKGSGWCLFLSWLIVWPFFSTTVNVNVLPTPGLLSKPISPLISSTRHLLILKPMPVPPYVREVELSACMKGIKTRLCACMGIPTPVSSTLTTKFTVSDVSGKDSLSISLDYWFIIPSDSRSLKVSQLFVPSAASNPLKVLHDPFELCFLSCINYFDHASTLASLIAFTFSARWTQTYIWPLSMNCKRKKQ